MASSFDFYSKQVEKLNEGLQTYWYSVAGGFADSLKGTAEILLGIYIILWGWSLMRGVVKEPFADGAFRMLRLATIVLIAVNVGRYSDFLATMLWTMPDALANIVTDASSDAQAAAQGAAFLDKLMGRFYDMGAAFNTAANADSGALGIPDMSLWISGVAVWGVGIVVTGYAAFLYVLSKVALALMLGLGPIFILMIMFEPTKKFFDAWLGQCVNYVVMVLLTAGGVSLILGIIETYLGTASVQASLSDPKINQVLPVIAFGIVGVLVLMQIPSMASALGGGVALGTLGAVGAMHARAKGAAGVGRDIASGKMLNDMRARRRAAATNKRWAASNPSMPKQLYRKITGGSQNRVARG